MTGRDYFSIENNKRYMSVSQFKTFSKCEFAAIEELQGRYDRSESTALLVGSYVDCWYEGTLDLFVHDHPQILKRDGTLKADFIQAELIIERAQKDEMFTRYMSGGKQVIMTGEIEGVATKVKIDSYHEGKAIVDLKVMKDFKPIYVPSEGRLNFIEAWQYDLQGAVYQEIVYQNTGKRLPFFIAGITKETEPDLAIFEVPQEVMDERLMTVRDNIERYALIKTGDIEPERCEKCDCCKATKKITKITSWEELNNYEL